MVLPTRKSTQPPIVRTFRMSPRRGESKASLALVKPKLTPVDYSINEDAPDVQDGGERRGTMTATMELAAIAKRAGAQLNMYSTGVNKFASEPKVKKPEPEDMFLLRHWKFFVGDQWKHFHRDLKPQFLKIKQKLLGSAEFKRAQSRGERVSSRKTRKRQQELSSFSSPAIERISKKNSKKSEPKLLGLAGRKESVGRKKTVEDKKRERSGRPGQTKERSRCQLPAGSCRLSSSAKMPARKQRSALASFDGTRVAHGRVGKSATRIRCPWRSQGARFGSSGPKARPNDGPGHKAEARSKTWSSV